MKTNNIEGCVFWRFQFDYSEYMAASIRETRLSKLCPKGLIMSMISTTNFLFILSSNRLTKLAVKVQL